MGSDGGSRSPERHIAGPETERLEGQLALVGRLVHLPRATLGLVVLFALLHFLVAGLAGNDPDRIVFYLLIAGAKVNELVLEGQWWRLLSSAFLHGTFNHLLVNAVGVLLLGWFVENGFSARSVLVLFVAASIAGSGLSVCLTETASVGASGGMFGLLGATLSYALLRWREVPRVMRLYVVGLPAIVGVASILHGVVADNVDNAAHLGGGGTGIVLGLLLLVRHRLGPEAQRLLERLALAALVILLVFSLGASVRHSLLHFELSETTLAVRDAGTAQAHFVPDGWESGRFRDGSCWVGESPAAAEEIACFIDPYFTMLLVGPSSRMAATGLFAEQVRRGEGEEPELYPHYDVLWGTDGRRRLDYALLVFAPLADKYLPLFAAVRADPGR